jgi:hypothetical protein
MPKFKLPSQEPPPKKGQARTRKTNDSATRALGKATSIGPAPLLQQLVGKARNVVGDALNNPANDLMGVVGPLGVASAMGDALSIPTRIFHGTPHPYELMDPRHLRSAATWPGFSHWAENPELAASFAGTTPSRLVPGRIMAAQHTPTNALSTIPVAHDPLFAQTSSAIQRELEASRIQDLMAMLEDARSRLPKQHYLGNLQTEFTQQVMNPIGITPSRAGDVMKIGARPFMSQIVDSMRQAGSNSVREAYVVNALSGRPNRGFGNVWRVHPDTPLVTPWGTKLTK